MELKICDRCGDNIEEEKGLSKLFSDATNALYLSVKRILGIRTYSIFVNETKPACLCDRCRENFDKWWADGKTQIFIDELQEDK